VQPLGYTVARLPASIHRNARGSRQNGHNNAWQRTQTLSHSSFPDEAEGISTMPQYVAAALSDVPDGSMHPVTVENERMLLIREGDHIHAIGGVCPHAGAPLEQGLRNRDRIVCPWHKATFCIRTGALLEPPAVDSVPAYSAHIEGQRVLVTIPPLAAELAVAKADPRTFAIIGAGGAGALAAQTLRHHGFNGRIVMLDRYNRVPYDRTLLSKYHLSGEPGAEKTPLQSQAFYKDHRIERCTAQVTALEPATKTITCADGSTLRYDAALLATGAAPSLPTIPGTHLRNTFLLRSIADADAILAQAERSETAVVLGASFIGMEVAASLRERGLGVTVVGTEAVPFQKQLGDKIGEVFVSLHSGHGVGFRLGRQVRALDGENTVRSVVLDNGERLPADLVVIGFGVKPVADYLRGVPLNEDGGVPVDANLRVMANDRPVDGLYAAGDIAYFPLYGGATSARIEHWRVAQQQGRIAALNMAGQPTQFDAVPVFWTIQYMKRLDYIGHAADWDDIVVHGDLEKPEFLAYFVRNGTVAAAAGLDRDQDTAALIELFGRRQDWTPSELGAAPTSLIAQPP
jgi:apoptosis-inducing factor 3